MPNRYRWMAVGLNLAVTVGFVYLAFGRLDFEQFVAVLSHTNEIWILLAVLAFALDFAVRIERWCVMLRRFAPDVPRRNCAGPLLASYAVNNVLPFRAGDILRVVAFRSQLRSRAMRVMGTLLIERLLDVLVLLVFLFFGLLLLPSNTLPAEMTGAATVLLGVAGTTLAVCICLPEKLTAIVRWGCRLTRLDRSTVGVKIDSLTQQFVESLRSLRSAGLLAYVAVLSLIAWALEGTAFALVAKSVHAEASLFGGWFAMSTATLGTMLPSTPGYVGTFDYFAIVGLEAFGAGKESAAAFSLVVHLLLWIGLTSIGGACLWFHWGSGWSRGLIWRSERPIE